MYRERVKKRQEAVRRARAEKFTMAQIARDVGTSPNNLRNLVKRGGQHSPFLGPLDEWLQTRGFWAREDAGAYGETPKGPLSLTAARLRALAAYLECSDISPEARVEELAASVKSLHDRMAELVSASQKFTEKGGVE